MLNRLTKAQIEKKLAFIDNYIKAANPADGSLVDANANVVQKTLATLETELHKFENIQINRALVQREIATLFGQELADQYVKDIEDHIIYIHDETSLKPYCASVSLYPFLFEGTKSIGGTSKAPKNLQSFCGSFVNLVYELAAGFAGAVATVEFLMYFDYFARQTYGDDYLEPWSQETRDAVAQALQGVVYTLNEPAATRGYQSVFWNISLFDQHYFESLFETFVFPDGSKPSWWHLERLQRFFLDWFRKERQRELLTFPVVTAAMLIDPETKKPRDEQFTHTLADQMSKGLSFFIYMSESADSLSSCCRLRNELADNEFSYTLGAGGVSTGSLQVITLNINRMDQWGLNTRTVVQRVHKYLVAHRKLQEKYLVAGLLPAYTAGFISMDKQFLTTGLNGVVEAAEFSKFTPGNNQEYKREFLIPLLSLIHKENQKAAKEYGYRFNTEFVPAESLGVKNAKWDKKDGLKVSRDCYNSYFFPVEDPNLTILDKMALHGREVTQYLDGGSALHLNLEQTPSRDTVLKLMETAARLGVNYWTTNILCTICNNQACGHIDPHYLKHCPWCGCENVDYGTRVIGYLKRISNFSNERQQEAARRYYTKEVFNG